MIASALAAVFFGCIAFIAHAGRAARLRRHHARAGRARAGKAAVRRAHRRPPRCSGGSLVAFGATPLQIGIAAIVVFALVACWCSDTICGIVPDVFTLAPLAALLLFAFAQRDWGDRRLGIIVFVPFAAAALFSRGYGMGWGDAKLVALVRRRPRRAACGLLRSPSPASQRSSGIGSRKRRRAPIAFAPYIAAATGIALPLGFLH